MTVFWGWSRLSSIVGINAGKYYNSDPTSRISNFALNWILNSIIFRPDSMKKWIFKTDQPGLGLRGPERLWLLTTRAPRVLKTHNAYIQEQPRPHQYVSLCNLQHLDTPQTQGLCMSVGWDQQQWQEYRRRPFSHCVAPSTVDVKPLDCRLCY